MSLKLAHSHHFFSFEERRELYLYLCLCLVLIACFGGEGGGLFWGAVGGQFKRELSYHTCVSESSRCALPFTHLLSSGETTTLVVSSIADRARASLSPLLPKKKEAALGVVKLVF